MSEETKSEDMSTNKAMDSITSDAVIKYDSLSSNRSKFSLLSEQTNLKTPPDNWLCGRFGDHNWSYPLQKHNSSMLSSFRMANSFPECVGSVDVIADSESIKKLLLMPFDSTHISLMVHRIGNTLLIDEFDLANHLIHNEEKQWSWLKRFIDDMIVPSCNKSLMIKKPITRDELQTKNILCKFLHYSVDHQNTESSSKPEANLQLSPKSSSKLDNDSIICEDNENKEFYFTHYNKESKMSEMVARKLDQIEEATDPGFLRNVLWTFEDIRMLVASNMPIFGDSNHPAVSLRLHDMKNPINVLTGLDYWLDNLMSSVPEVVMCYHLDGIVEKYELIKTEEIPDMTGKKLFSPKIIRNIAQNILSFLKSNATKAGHTYWLFKGKHDDVVKLYDLTTLCADYMGENDSNPFSIPVATLLYRVAKNMRDANPKLSPKVRAKIHKLLTHCLSLLDFSKHSQIVSSANYLLSDVYVPNDIDPTLLPLNYNQNNGEDDEDFDDFDSCDSSDDSNCPTLEVNKLGFEDYYKKDKQKKQKPSNEASNEGFDETELDWNVRCERALKHIIEGLKCIHESNLQKPEDILYNTSTESSEESQKMANPSEAIPLNYSSLSQKKKNSTNSTIKGNELTQIKGQSIPDWTVCLEVCLLRKGAQVFCILAELANSKTECFKALKYIRMGIMCYEIAVALIEKNSQSNYLKEPIACLLALCGDIHIKILSSQMSSGSNEDTNDSNDVYCTQMTDILEKMSETGLKEEFRWAFNPVINSEKSVEQRLKLCYRCYEESLFQLNDTKQKNKVESDLHQRIVKRMGYICNELANHYMNESLKYFNQIVNNSSKEQSLDETQVNRLDSLTKKSNAYFEKAIELFRKVKDKENVSLMLSNMGRLMRTCAHIFAPVFRQNIGSKEFSSKEKHFYCKAIECYKSALTELGSDRLTKYRNAMNNINWELCTTLYTIGCLMQEFAPLTTSAFEVVEKEIIKRFTEALDLCENGQKWDNSRLVLYQYRAATVSHRLGSLHHNSYRNMTEETDSRKKTFNSADRYYEKSSSIYRQLNDREETLRVTLERISLHESNLTQLNGFGSKVKALNLILSIIVTIDEIDIKDIESGEEKQKIEEMLDLFVTRITFAVKGLIKCLNSKASKHKDSITKWKELDESINSTINLRDIDVFEKVKRICRHLVSSKLIESYDRKK